MESKSWRFTPRTNLGWWSIGLVIAMPLLFIIGTSFAESLYRSVSSGETILADIAARPALALTMLAGMGCGVFAFVTGIVDIIKKKEIAILVFVSTIIGALFIVYLAAELFFPH